MFSISCNFGIGYETLINHLAYGVNLISHDRAKQLGKTSPKEIRHALLGKDVQEPLVFVDQHWTAPTVDLEVGTFLLIPPGLSADGPVLRHCHSFAATELFQAATPGLGRLVDKKSRESRFVRVSRFQFAGLSKFRHLEEDTEK